MESKKTTSENNEEIVNPPITDAESTDNKSTGSIPTDKGETKKEEKLSHKLEKENESLKKELDEQKDKYLRLIAEYDNYRKRTLKEKCDSYSDAFTKAIISFLPLIDNIERAQEYAKDDEGIKAILKQLSDILTSLDVTAIESDGKSFDPNLHNAIMHEEDENAEENLIVQTLQKGYMLSDKVIRHAMVKVVN